MTGPVGISKVGMCGHKERDCLYLPLPPLHPTHTDTQTCIIYMFLCIIFLNLYCIIYAKEKEYRRKEISKRADFEFELRRNGASGPDRGNDAKSQSLAKGLSEWILL